MPKKKKDQTPKQPMYGEGWVEPEFTSYDEAKRRYTGGVGDYKTLLDLIKSSYSIEITLLNIEKAIIINYIDLYRALGKR